MGADRGELQQKEGRQMGHNRLLDGNTDKDGPSVERTPWMADTQVGFAVNWESWQLADTVAIRSRAFDSQSGTDSVGSLTLSMWL